MLYLLFIGKKKSGDNSNDQQEFTPSAHRNIKIVLQPFCGHVVVWSFSEALQVVARISTGNVKWTRAVYLLPSIFELAALNLYARLPHKRNRELSVTKKKAKAIHLHICRWKPKLSEGSFYLATWTTSLLLFTAVRPTSNFDEKYYFRIDFIGNSSVVWTLKINKYSTITTY